VQLRARWYPCCNSSSLHAPPPSPAYVPLPFKWQTYTLLQTHT
jgi:hypothetical protein